MRSSSLMGSKQPKVNNKKAVFDEGHLSLNVGADVVICLGGLRGRVTRVQLHPDTHQQQQVQVVLTSWRLPGVSSVLCCLSKDCIVAVLRTSEDDESLDYVRRLKQAASQCLEQQQTGAALSLYMSAVDCLQQMLTNTSSTSSSPSQHRGNTLVWLVQCSDQAGKLALTLERYDQALDLARNSLVVLDALEKQQQRTATSTSVVSLGQVKLFGECRVQAFLIAAQAWVALEQPSSAKPILKAAQTLLKKYTTAELRERSEFKPILLTLLRLQKQIKQLKRECSKMNRNNIQEEKKEDEAPTSWWSSSGARSPKRRRRVVWFADDDNDNKKTKSTRTTKSSSKDIARSSKAPTAGTKDSWSWYHDPHVWAVGTLVAGGILGTALAIHCCLKRQRR